MKKIEYKEEMYFSEIESDFIYQISSYLKQNKKFDLCLVKSDIYKIVRLPYIMIKFMNDGFGYDEDGNTSFVNYIDALYSFVYSTNKEEVRLISYNVCKRKAKQSFERLFKDKLILNSRDLFKDNDEVLFRLAEEKLNLRINRKFAVEVILMIADFINVYMGSRGIRVLKLEKLDEEFNPILPPDENEEELIDPNDPNLSVDPEEVPKDEKEDKPDVLPTVPVNPTIPNGAETDSTTTLDGEETDDGIINEDTTLDGEEIDDNVINEDDIPDGEETNDDIVNEDDTTDDETVNGDVTEEGEEIVTPEDGTTEQVPEEEPVEEKYYEFMYIKSVVKTILD